MNDKTPKDIEDIVEAVSKKYLLAGHPVTGFQKVDFEIELKQTLTQLKATVEREERKRIRGEVCMMFFEIDTTHIDFSQTICGVTKKEVQWENGFGQVHKDTKNHIHKMMEKLDNPEAITQQPCQKK